MDNSRFKICAIYIAFLLIFPSFSVSAQNLSAKYLNYIDKYKDLAIKHQQAYGIPASITLAQGLLESQAGDSPLASKGKNHFGIKCHSTWKGDKIYHDDDELQECFRKYKHDEDSFEDHARFLKRKRYTPLFSLETTDYKGWAKTLRKCGYATDPKYPEKLIGIIERYQLNLYDTNQPIVTKRQYLQGDETIEHDIENAILDEVTMMHNIRQKGNMHYIKTYKGDTFASIASEFGMKVNKLLSFNDFEKIINLKPNTILYLQEKNKTILTGNGVYRVKKGDTLHSISQQLGIKLKSLCKLNSLKKDDILSTDMVLRVR